MLNMSILLQHQHCITGSHCYDIFSKNSMLAKYLTLTRSPKEEPFREPEKLEPTSDSLLSQFIIFLLL